MPWQTMDVEEQKVRFVVAATRQEKSFTALCQEFGISRPTGCLWRKRYQEAGLAGIAERSRRPRQSPTRTTADLEQRVVEMRQRYPDWGARKLQVLLAREKLELTRSTIHRVLLRHDLVRDQDRHSQATSRFERSAPNELWQMDFKSPKGWNAAVGPLAVLDDHSRYLLVLQAVWSAHGELVREQLETAFASCGVPQAMLMDHGIPWWSARAPTGAPREQPQPWLDAYRWEHNHVRPHEALNMQTPANLWHKSERRYNPHPPRWEYPSGAHVLKVGSQGNLDAYGARWKIAKALRGEWVQLEQVAQRVLVYYCQTLVRELDLKSRCSTAVERWLPNQEAE